MTSSAVKIEEYELRYLMRCMECNKGIRIFVNRLMRRKKIKSKEYTVIKAEKIKIKDVELLFIVVGLNYNKAKVVFIKGKQYCNIFGSIIEDKHGKEIMKGYKISNNHIKQIVSKDYDDDFKQDLKKLEDSEKYNCGKEKIRKEGIPCLYGNWCGPGCSGPGAPISPVDACCKAHDICYDENGYFSKSCDDKLIHCLEPYVVQGNKWAILISNWFRH